MIQVKRVYEPVAKSDGSRFLVDRLWPRGVKKEKAELKGWAKEIAPSAALRNWFGHDPEKWPEFKRRYQRELKTHQEELQSLLKEAKKGTVTLLFGAKDEKHNNAVILKEFLEK